MLDVAPRRRHPGSMNTDSKSATVRSLDRINLRLAGETFAAIDDACAARPGNVSRNTWIAEAIEEKLARDRMAVAANEGERRAHG
jgi:predicted HicB family RNase H-like nuclease